MSDTRPFVSAQRNAGYTLIEIMLVATVIGIVAAVAVPQIGRARAASYETSTIASLQLIRGAQAGFASSCAGGFYAPSMVWLSRPPASGGAPFIGVQFQTNVIDRSGYRLRFSAGNAVATSPPTCNGLGRGRSVDRYFVEAAPLTALNGSRYFGVSQRSVIFQSTRRVAPIFTGDPPPPARPIQ
jgi:prepilin-type N-terminal cleavage/methylation domain-containing protein